jgi:hypothetical protein
MSGQQIGSTIGLIVGSYFGGPVGGAIGSAIGGYIGGAIDPTIIKGPKIGDGQTQTSTDGQVIAWIQGTAMCAGTIVQVSPRRQIRHKDGGKGSGTVTETFTAQQDFAIAVCESCELRDSTVSQILMVYQDGKLVYDVRPGSAILSDSAKWKANVDFLYGGEDQMPHPTLEAITGVGNTPAYRGMCLAVFKSFDVTSAGDRIPAFQFVVATAGFPAVNVAYTDIFKYKSNYPGSTEDYSSPSYDDSDWNEGPGGFGNFFEGMEVGTLIPDQGQGQTIWIRKTVDINSGAPVTIHIWTDNWADLYIDGEIYYSTPRTHQGTDQQVFVWTATRNGSVTFALRTTEADEVSDNKIFVAMSLSASSIPSGVISLDTVCGRICKRGGLGATDIDLSPLPDATPAGYIIATASNASDCLAPLLQAYFCFASEYDNKIHFHPYGDDAAVTLSLENLVERDGSDTGLVTYNTRRQETEFPQRIVASYYDPAQNYQSVNVTSRRRASTVKAIGDQAFQIPVAISATLATQAADKALKIAYATLQGTIQLSTPFADTECYLQLPSGFPVIFEGKRYVINEMALSQGTIDFTLRYDRQSAYTSNVQPILGNAPSVPASRYSGPTTLIAMNLPAQRPQDSIGVYLAAASSDGRNSWLGCNVQVSYDGQETWQQAVQIVMESNMGTFTADEPPGGEPLSVEVLKFGLESATPAQLAAAQNSFAAVDSDGTAQLGQFATATETSDKNYQLTNVQRGLGGTAVFDITSGMPFTLMDAAYFLPIAPQWAGREIFFRAIGFGEVAEDAPVVSIIYTALVRSEGVPRLTQNNVQRVTEDGFLNRFTES